MLLISVLPTLLALSPGSLGSSPSLKLDEIELRFAPREGATHLSHFELQRTSETGEHELVMNEEQVLMSGSGQESTEELSIRVRESYARVGEMGPERIERSYVELNREKGFEGLEDHVHGDVGENTSPLEGLSVAFTKDEDAGGFAAEWLAEEGQDSWLEDLEEDMSLRALLPRDAVSVGDAWDIDPEALAHVLAPGGGLWPEVEEDDSEHPPGALVIRLPSASFSQGLEHYEGSFRGELADVREEAGLRLARIEFQLDLRASIDDPESMGSDDPEYDEYGLERSVRGTGHLVWDLDAGLFHSMELDLETEESLDCVWSASFGGGEAMLSHYREATGEMSVRVTREPDEL